MNLQTMGRVLAFLILGFGLNAAAMSPADKPCSRQEAIEAERDIDNLKGWDRAYRWYRRFSNCDDAAIAEGYSDAVSRLLAKNWLSAKRFMALTAKDNAFESFVLKHLDSTVPEDRLREIAQNAETRCPKGAERLCQSIDKAARK